MKLLQSGQRNSRLYPMASHEGEHVWRALVFLSRGRTANVRKPVLHVR